MSDTYYLPKSSFRELLLIDTFNYYFKKPQKYTFGQIVTRDNFTSLSIDSFAKSGGQSTAQAAYFEWLLVNIGFDYRKTYDNYDLAGGFRSLWRNEQQMIIKAFKKAHKKVQGGDRFDRNWMDSYQIIGEKIDFSLNVLEAGPKVKSKFPKDRLKGLGSYDFLLELRGFVAELRNSPEYLSSPLYK